MTVKEIIIKYLKENNFDGLYYRDYCACDIDDLCPCDDNFDSCKAGIKLSCEGNFIPDDCGENCDFHIGKKERNNEYTI